MTIVVFDPTEFKLVYPEFASGVGDTPDARCTAMFQLAEATILDNTANSPVMDLTFRTQLFYMLVAHLLLLFGTGAAPTLNNAPPGRVSSATQGTVSSAFEYNIPSGSAMAAWFLQTKYGALYWTTTARFRSAQYFASGNSGIGTARAYGANQFNVPGGV